MSNDRPETGPIKFGDDWTGVFFRGDDALHYALALKGLLDMTPPTEDHESSPVLAKMILKGLVDSLMACNDGSHEPCSDVEVFTLAAQPVDKPGVRKLRPFDECLWPGTLK